MSIKHIINNGEISENNIKLQCNGFSLINDEYTVDYSMIDNIIVSGRSGKININNLGELFINDTKSLDVIVPHFDDQLGICLISPILKDSDARKISVSQSNYIGDSFVLNFTNHSQSTTGSSYNDNIVVNFLII